MIITRRLLPTIALCLVAVPSLAAPVMIHGFDVKGDPPTMAKALSARLAAVGVNGDLVVRGDRLWLVTTEAVAHVGDLIAPAGLLLAPVVGEPEQPPVPDMLAVPDRDDPKRIWSLDAKRGLSPKVVEASATHSAFGQWEVSLTFDAVGAEAFFALSKSLVDRKLAIVVGDRVLSAPVVREAIAGGRVLIHLGGKADPASAKRMADRLKAGPLPGALTLAHEATGDRVEEGGRTRVSGGPVALTYATPARWNPTACRITGRRDCAVIIIED